jgi:hypothetical protein
MVNIWDNRYGGRPVSSHANSSDCFQLAMRWIQSCLTEHDGCRRAVCPYEYTGEWVDQWRYESRYESFDDNSDDDDDSSEDCDQPSPKRRKLESGNDSSTSQDSSPFQKYTPFPQVTKPTLLRTGLLNRYIPVTRVSKSFLMIATGIGSCISAAIH